MIKEVIAACIFILIFSPAAFAVFGVSPPVYTVDFQPNLRQTFNFNFIFDGGVQSNLYAQGDLAQYASIEPKKIIGSEGVVVTIQFPGKIDIPGEHVIYIGALQQPDSGAGFSLVGNIKGMIIVNVPYPHKYAVVSLTAIDAKSGEPVSFNADINNLAVEDITANAEINVYDSSNNTVAAIPFAPVFIKSTKSASLTAQLNTTENQAGFYTAIINVGYGGEKPATAFTSFRLGQLFVNLTNYSDYFERDKINKLDLNIESFWNDPITDVYANVTLPDYGISFTTPSINLERFGEGTLTGYFDTTGIPKDIDNFNAKILLNYGGKRTERIIVLKFKKEINYLIYGLIACVILAMIVLLILMAVHKRLREKKERRLSN